MATNRSFGNMLNERVLRPKKKKKSKSLFEDAPRKGTGKSYG